MNAIGDRGCELTVNRRQRADWERAALDQLRHGDVESAYRAYRDHDRVTVCATHDELHQRIADEWAESTWWDVETLIVAGTRTEARLLNDRARAAAERLGRLSGPPLTVAGRSFHVGDEVILTRNDPSQTDLGTGGRRRVDNGTRGRITEISPDGRVDVITTIGEHIRLDPAYLGAGYLDHGYAVTIHKSQGITCDKVLVAGPRGLSREAGYVAMSRGRLGAQLFTTVDHDDALTHHHQRPRLDDRDPHDSLVGALSRRSVKRFATNDRPLLVEASELAAGRTLAAIHERLGYVEAVIRDLALAGRVDPVDLHDRLARATLTRCRIRPGSRVRAADRDNVGTIALIADSAGAAWTRFRSETGHISHRWMPWEELTPLDDAESAPTELPAAARRHLRVLELEVRAEQERWSRLLATHGIRSDERDLLMAAIHQRTERLAHRLAAQPPAWLDEIIGPAPDDAIGRAVWGDELRRIAAWRDLHRVGPEQPGYGPPPLDPALHHAWLAQHGRSRRIHAWITEQYGDRPEPSGRLRTLESIRRRLRSEQILERDARTDLAVISDDPSSRDRPIPPPSTQDLDTQVAVPAAGRRPIGRRSTGITIA